MLCVDQFFQDGFFCPMVDAVHGDLQDGCSEAAMVMQLRRLLRICDLTAIPEISFYSDYRTQLASNVRADPYVLFAWQRMCELEATTEKVNQKLDNGQLFLKRNDIRAIMFSDPDEIYGELKKLFAECGMQLPDEWHSNLASVLPLSSAKE
jgi:HTH-type transcriptional regulator/antitoxin HigA